MNNPKDVFMFVIDVVCCVFHPLPVAVQGEGILSRKYHGAAVSSLSQVQFMHFNSTCAFLFFIKAPLFVTTLTDCILSHTPPSHPQIEIARFGNLR